MKRIVKILLLCLLIISMKNVQATVEQDTTKASNEIINFKISEGDFVSSIEDFKYVLPFLNIATKNITYDKTLISSGISIGNESIHVKKDLKGIQILMASDTVTIEGNCEYAIILATNVVIKGKVEKDLFIFAQSIFITETAEIGNDVTIVSNKAEIKGKILGNLLGRVQELSLYGIVEKDLRIKAKTITIKTEQIKGDMVLFTDSNAVDLLKQYPNALIEKYTLIPEQYNQTVYSFRMITKGIMIILTYTLIAFLINRKENNFTQCTTEKIKKYTPYTFLMGVSLIVLFPAVLLILIVLSLIGLGFISWPILLAYLAFIILVWILDILIVGLILINIIIEKIGKNKLDTKKKILIYLSIFLILYLLKYVSSYVPILYAITSTGIVFTAITKRTNKKEKEKSDKQENKEQAKIDEKSKKEKEEKEEKEEDNK